VRFRIIVEEAGQKLEVHAENKDEEAFLGVLNPAPLSYAPIHVAEVRLSLADAHHFSARRVKALTIVFTPDVPRNAHI
jgi:hypothetical protein